MNPLLLGLARLVDRIRALADHGDQTAALIGVQLVQLLDAAGITPFEPGHGEAFDPSRHRGAMLVGTAHPEVDGVVARCVAPGWEHSAGHLLRVADVEVYRFHGPSS